MKVKKETIIHPQMRTAGPPVLRPVPKVTVIDEMTETAVKQKEKDIN